MQIISGLSNQVLAKQIAGKLSCQLLKSETTNFKDGELKIQIYDQISREVAIVQSTSCPANDHLMELLLLADTVKRAGAKEIIAIIPYFGYSRQDRCTYKYGPLSASLVIRMLEAAGVTKVITVDLHSAQLEGVFSVPVINISIDKVFLPKPFSDDQLIVISPDIGGITRARNFSTLLGCNLAIINKSRDNHNVLSMSEIYGDVEGKNCLLVDDIVDSGNTLCKAAELLFAKGVKSVEAYISHAVLSGQAKDLINKSPINKVYVSDSICHDALPAKFEVTPIAPLLASILS